jgi:hypothetical protein
MANNKSTSMRPNSEEDWKNGQRHAPAALYPREGPPVPIGRLGGTQSRSRQEARGKILCLFRGSNLDRQFVQSDPARHYTD